MILEAHRCIKCNTKYDYQKSGYGCGNELNNSQYCPGCMKIINEALKDVPKKFHSEHLPILDEFSRKVSVEEFDKKFDEYKKDHIVAYPVLYGFDGKVRELFINGREYREYIGSNEETIITAKYEINQNDEVTGLW